MSLPLLSLFCAILGCGVQLLLIFVCVLTLAVIRVFYPYSSGTAGAAVAFVYALTAAVAGYTSGSMYRSMGGTRWLQNALLTCTLFAVPTFCVVAYMNTVANMYSATVAVPFGALAVLFALYFLVATPLTLAGAVVGKKNGGHFGAPTRPNSLPREAPPAKASPPWYHGAATYVFWAGVVPFAAVYFEMRFMLLSIWGSQLFAPLGRLYLVFVIMLMVGSWLTVFLAFGQVLDEKRNEWRWRSIFAGSSTALCIFIYCVVFLFTETKMSGLLQLSFYFGYMSILCYAILLVLGAVGFFASRTFARRLYRSVECNCE